jgi:RNase adaptor protein for sRNA GlmZ degradation
MLLNKETERLAFYVADDLLEHLNMMYIETFNGEAYSFIEWVLNEYDFNDDIQGFVDEADDNVSNNLDKTNKDYLYDRLIKNVNVDRKLYIYSYGKRHRKKPPTDCQCTFNACILNSNRAGLDLKKMTGLDRDIQKRVETCSYFDTFMEMLITKIEKDNLHTIAIYCSAGKHRSVSCCEILKNRIYPKSTIYHMELNKYR